MQHSLDVENWNRTFPKYPMTVRDKGWVYGVWYCGTSFQRARLYGEYPLGFVKRALALFPTIEPSRILHCPSGTVQGPGVTVDVVSDRVRIPQILASADCLPFKDNTFDLVLSDPPYSVQDAAKYGTGPYPLHHAMKEAKRVLDDGGYFGILHTRYPSYRRTQGWRLVALVCVVTGCARVTRIFSIFQVKK